MATVGRGAVRVARRGVGFDEALRLARARLAGDGAAAVREDMKRLALKAAKIADGVAGVDEASPVGAEIHAKARRRYLGVAKDYAALEAKLAQVMRGAR